jgi:two-component sensor histidine kinase
VDTEEISVNIDFAVPFGLILNELITNALQHGFRAGERGTLRIAVAREGDYVRLVLADSGPGIPEDFDLRQTSSLGLKLVSALTEQLHGTVSVRNNAGSEWTVKLLDADYRRP